MSEKNHHIQLLEKECLTAAYNSSKFRKEAEGLRRVVKVQAVLILILIFAWVWEKAF